MFCRNCGKEIEDSAIFCVHCGCETGVKPANPTPPTAPTNNMVGVSKQGLGILFGVLLGFIGLIIGICLYPNESIERSTFIKGWIIGFVICLVASVALSALTILLPYLLLVLM